MVGVHWNLPAHIGRGMIYYKDIKRGHIEPKGTEYIHILETNWNWVHEPYIKCKTHFVPSMSLLSWPLMDSLFSPNAK